MTISTVASAKQDSAAKHLLKAKRLIKRNEYNKAIDLLKNALKSMPVNSEIYLNLGIVYNKKKEYELAIRHFEKAEELGVNKNVTAFESGFAYEQLGYYKEAVKLLKKSLSYKKNNHRKKNDIMFEIGYCYYRQKNYDNSFKYFNKIKNASKDKRVKVLFIKGVILYEQKKYKGALRNFKRIKLIADKDTRQPALKYIKGIESIGGKGKKNYSLKAALSIVSDSNVMTMSDANPLDISKKDDVATLVSVFGQYNIFRIEDSILAASYSFYQKTYQDISGYDLLYHRAALNYATSIGTLGTFFSTYDYNYFELDEKRYFSKNGIRLKVRQKKKSYLEISTLFDVKDYYKQNELDSDNYGAGITKRFAFDVQKNIDLSYFYNVEDTTGKEYDFTAQKLQAGFDYPLWGGVLFGVDAAIQNKDYANINPAYLKKRKDVMKTVNVTLKRDFADSLSALFKYDFTKNNSNFDYSDYDREIISLGISYLY